MFPSLLRHAADPPRKTLHSSYHPQGYGVSEGMKRARRPFIVKNILLGSTLMSTAIGIYMYSIYKIKQDDFSDVGLAPAGEQPIAGSPMPSQSAIASGKEPSGVTTSKQHSV